MFRRLLPGLLLLLFLPRLGGLRAAPAREVVPLERWEFAAEQTAGTRPPEDAPWGAVNVPHVFRASGLPDDTAGWYRCRPDPAPGDEDAGRRLCLRLEGAASVKEVFVNGRSVGQHRGAFSAACFDLSAPWKPDGPNEIAVRVSNRAEETVGCLSRSNLYYVNGGLFRPVSLIRTGAVHVFPELGSSGVSLTTAGDELGVRTVVRNTLDRPAGVTVRHTVTGPEGAVCAAFSTTETLPAGAIAPVRATARIDHPKLWDLGQPNLYRVRVEVLVNGQATDEVTERTGFRAIARRDGRFLLNGREVRFVGVNKHEQTEARWNAANPAASREEFRLLADLGVNTVRLAHYPHSQLEYDLADELGLAVWAENGFAGQFWQKDAPGEERRPTPDGERLSREMVRQLGNHPGILFWSAGNETVVPTVERYAEVIREEDSSRLITYAANAAEPRNCDFVARNVYSGWYGSGHLSGFVERPGGSALVSETGAGSWPTHHVPYADAFRWKVNVFEPEEYAGMFAEYRLQTVCRDDPAGHPMFLWWLLRDFFDHKLKGRLNSKGLVGPGGAPKDLFFLFQAFLRPDHPVVHLCGANHFLRAFAPDDGIKAYANAPALELFVNGVSRGKKANGEYRIPDAPERNPDNSPRFPGLPVANVFFWNAPLSPGRNVIEVRDATGSGGAGPADRMVVYQAAPDGSVPAAPEGLVRELTSSNPGNPAAWIERPAQAQGPVYSAVDGSSDNTFAALSPELAGATWIATNRLSDPAQRTDLSFQVAPGSAGAMVFVMFSTGTFPEATLKGADPAIVRSAQALKTSLAAAGFRAAGAAAPLWRDHELDLAHAALWSRPLGPGERLRLPGQTLDYVILVRGE